MNINTVKLYRDQYIDIYAVDTNKGFEVWSYSPAYNHDGITYRTTVATVEEARKLAWEIEAWEARARNRSRY
jgi:hypothetical protein